ncbi:MAG TPA: altronate dehydratase family protein [Burkholderiaceae bacterium]|nr:altronate dehydratase family protein [Burkholderiaceae bacterium]
MSAQRTPPALLRLHPTDNVSVARIGVAAGDGVDVAGGGCLEALQDVPPGHKVATCAIPAGGIVLKYGQPIGVATRAIAAGEHVHSHNLDMGGLHARQGSGSAYVATTLAGSPATFEGFVRPGGGVGTRNFVGVVSSVNCSATVCKAIERAFAGEAMAAWPGVDGVVAITHGTGCGMSGSGEGIELLRRTLRGYAGHANFAAVLVIGLGCEVNQVDGLVEGLDRRVAETIRTLTIQEAGGTRAAIDQGVAIVRAMLETAQRGRRETVSADRLVVGLQCGGSDGYSGISANPALGAAVDELARHGGTAILSETPEIYGAEHLLTARAAAPAIASRLLDRLRWWETYTRGNGGDMNNNPSPGNKAGGITTILEKALGAVAKGGTTGLMEVLEYAEPVRARGLVFMDTPGFDPVSATGQVAGGANLICFTTGRGSTYGCKPVPSIKIATNSALFSRMALDMDFNAGDIVDGTLSVAEAGQRLFRLMLATASGQRTSSEQHDLGNNEFVPWQLGAVM